LTRGLLEARDARLFTPSGVSTVSAQASAPIAQQAAALEAQCSVSAQDRVAKVDACVTWMRVSVRLDALPHMPNANGGERGVSDTRKLANVARQHEITTPSSRGDDDGVDERCPLDDRERLACQRRERSAERFDVDRIQDPCGRTSLPPPPLADDGGGNGDPRAGAEGGGHERQHDAIASLDGDQRPRIERDHRRWVVADARAFVLVARALRALFGGFRLAESSRCAAVTSALVRGD